MIVSVLRIIDKNSMEPLKILNNQFIDSFNRIHDYLRISLTERCNLRCFYCMPKEGIPLRDKSHFMKSEEIFRIAKLFTDLGVKKIRLTGGEPLIRKCSHEIIRELGTLNVELAITTNGILVDQFIDTFKEAGIKSINLSLDSLKPERQAIITRRNYFNRILRNIHLLLDEGFHVKINMVVMNKVNDDELIDFVELTKYKPLHVRFIEFMPFNGNEWNWSNGIGYDKMMRTFRSHYTETAILKLNKKPNETAKCFHIEGYLGTFGIISSVTHPFCSTCNRIRLTADGKMKNCLFSPQETDLLNPLRNGENIIPLILKNIHSKKEKRAGMETLDDLFNPAEIMKNRSMVAIGG
jgi:GTP 3',8-cyclase